MREIKFRAWNGEAISESFKPWSLIPSREGGLMDLHGFSVMWVGSGWEWMQYTGLKDRTGKEIYEGDIVNIEYDTVNEIGEDSTDYKENVVVEWEYELLCQIEYDNKGIEIIGNIYENPELLEDK